MIYLIRHFNVKDTSKSWINSAEFDQWVNDYDGFDLDDSPLLLPPINQLYVSSYQRAIKTAQSLSASYTLSHLLIEVDPHSFIKTSLPLPKWLWLVMARIQWYFNSSHGENRIDTMQRIEEFFTSCDLTQNVAIISHGFVMKTMIKMLKKRGFVGDKALIPSHGKMYCFHNLARSE